MIENHKFLNASQLRNNLMLSSLYLSAYEIFKSSIIDNISAFFSTDYVAGKLIPNQQYHDEVKKVNKDLLKASCLWLVNVGAISMNELQEILEIRKHRNEIAHELPQLLGDDGRNLRIDYFIRIRELLGKIELWWVRNFVIPTNSQFDGVEIADNEIQPGRAVMLDYIISVALEDYLSEMNEKLQSTS